MPTSPDFFISPLRVLTLPAITFFHLASQPTPFSNLDAVLDPLLDGLYQARGQAGLSEPGPDIVRYYPVAGGEGQPYILETGIAVKADTPPAGLACVQTLPPYTCAGVLLWGGLPHIGQAYEALTREMNAAGLRHNREVRECTYSFESPDSPNNLMGIYMGIA